MHARSSICSTSNPGVLGVSGVSRDMRTLLASDSPAAQEAIDLFVYRIGRELGSLAAAPGMRAMCNTVVRFGSQLSIMSR